MSTLAGIKNALSPGDNVFSTAKTVGDAEIARIKAWFEADYAEQLDGAAATADDFGGFLWRQIRAKVINYERKVAEQAIAEPDELTEA